MKAQTVDTEESKELEDDLNAMSVKRVHLRVILQQHAKLKDGRTSEGTFETQRSHGVIKNQHCSIEVVENSSSFELAHPAIMEDVRKFQTL